MGYYARGYGNIVVKKEEDADKVEKLINEFMDSEYYAEELSFEVWYDGKFRSDSFDAFLSEIEPYTKSGIIKFTGEDDCIWKYEFAEESWKEYSAGIIYEEDDLFIVLPENLQGAIVCSGEHTAKNKAKELLKNGFKSVILPSKYKLG